MNMNIQNIYLKMCDHFINNHTIVYLIIAYAHKLHYKHYTKNDNVLKFISMNINDKWNCDLFLSHILSINVFS